MDAKKLLRSPIVLVLLTLIIIPPFLIKSNLLNRKIIHRGTVVDALGARPVELTRLMVGNNETFSDYLGEFSIEQNIWYLWLPFKNNNSELQVFPTYDYESPADLPSCNEFRATLTETEFRCRAIVYPQPFNVVTRFLSEEINGGTGSSEEISRRQERSWELLAAPSQKIWANKADYVDSLALYQIIKFKLGDDLVNYQVSREIKSLSSLNYLGSQNISGELVAVPVELHYRSGADIKEDLYLRRENRVWKMLSGQNSVEVKFYNAKFNWVLKRK